MHLGQAGIDFYHLKNSEPRKCVGSSVSEPVLLCLLRAFMIPPARLRLSAQGKFGSGSSQNISAPGGSGYATLFVSILRSRYCTYRINGIIYCDCAVGTLYLGTFEFCQASQSFAGSLTALEVRNLVEAGWRIVLH